MRVRLFRGPPRCAEPKHKETSGLSSPTGKKNPRKMKENGTNREKRNKGDLQKFTKPQGGRVKAGRWGGFARGEFRLQKQRKTAIPSNNVKGVGRIKKKNVKRQTGLGGKGGR